MPPILHHDFESFCEASLPDVGVSRYWRHSTAEVLMCAYALDDEPVEQWVPVEGQKMPAKLEDALLDERVIKMAWNKPFEWNGWKHAEGIEIPHEQWRDPMILAYTLSLPGALEKAAPIVGLPLEYQKKTNGKALMRWFSMLRPATKKLPIRRVHWYEQLEKWEEYKEYNRQDVEAERAFWRRMKKYDLPADEWEAWVADQEINEAGIPINIELARRADESARTLIESRLDRMKDVTDLDNPNSRDPLLEWLQENGYPYDDLKKGHVKRALERLYDACQDAGGWEENRDLIETLELRLEAGQAAVKKFSALVSHADEDGVLRYCHQFAAAGRTWRWGGRVFQPQNLVKPEKSLEGLDWKTHEDGTKEVVGGPLIRCVEAVGTYDAEELDLLYTNPMDMISATVRPVVQAPPGHILLDADLKAIENVVLGWLSNDQRILGVFRDNRDPYVDFATYLYERPYAELFAEYQAGNKAKRTIAKPGVLGCGYGLSAGYEYENKKTGEMEATGLLQYARDMGVELTREQAELSVSVWRKTFKRAVEFWYEMEKAAMRCVRTRKETSVGPIGFDYKKPFMRMILPSGRPLYYVRPRIEDRMKPWGDVKPTLTYEGLGNQRQWIRIETFYGKLVENADQATARDLLKHGIMNARREGLDVRMHVHDQIVALSASERARRELKTLVECMTDIPEWAKGMPVMASGHISKWFVKD